MSTERTPLGNVPFIRARLAELDEDVVANACARAATLVMRDVHDEILALTRAKSLKIRLAAVRALRRLWVDTDFETVFGVYRRDPDETMRHEAAWVLRETASTRTWSRLFDLWCRDAHPRHRVWACEIAQRFASTDELPALRRLLDDRDGLVRAAAVPAVRRFEGR
jgi:HEAT repeat protein